MKLLTVGNSFAVNSCRYLGEICKPGGPSHANELGEYIGGLV